MGLQQFGSTSARIGKFSGAILKHAVMREVLTRQGRQVSRQMPGNSSDTYVSRRFMPYGALATDYNTQNRFFQNGTGDRGNAMVIAHQTGEGITSGPDSMTAVDVTTVIQQYSCLYGFSDKMYDLHEDDFPKEMTKQIGERVSLVNEMIVYGVLRACLNAFFGGTGTTIATVNGAPTLGMIRRMTKTLKANHAMPVTSMLSSDKNYGSEAVEAGFFVYCHTNLEPDIRDMPGFTPTVKYASGKPVPNEIGKVENFRFVTSPDLPELQDAGAAIGTTGLYSTSGSLIDVYPIIVCAEDAWSQIVVRGKDALDSTYLPPSKKDKSDPHGQRGYAGTKWYKAVALENHGWMCVGYVGSKIVS